jgi:hypothetical protein
LHPIELPRRSTFDIGERFLVVLHSSVSCERPVFCESILPDIRETVKAVKMDEKPGEKNSFSGGLTAVKKLQRTDENHQENFSLEME